MELRYGGYDGGGATLFDFWVLISEESECIYCATSKASKAETMVG